MRSATSNFSSLRTFGWSSSRQSELLIFYLPIHFIYGNLISSITLRYSVCLPESSGTCYCLVIFVQKKRVQRIGTVSLQSPCPLYLSLLISRSDCSLAGFLLLICLKRFLLLALMFLARCSSYIFFPFAPFTVSFSFICQSLFLSVILIWKRLPFSEENLGTPWPDSAFPINLPTFYVCFCGF